MTVPVWAMPLSLTTTRGITVVFSSSPYLDVSVRGVRLRIKRMTGLQPAGLPHSDIQGSTLICSYPWLFAACHVLLRLREPRHPPHALGYFTYPNDITAPPIARSAAHSCLLYCSREKSFFSIVFRFSFDLTFLFSRVSFQHVKEPWRCFSTARVENKGLEPLTPSLQS